MVHFGRNHEVWGDPKIEGTLAAVPCLKNFAGHKFWALGYFVSTVGRDEEMH